MNRRCTRILRIIPIFASRHPMPMEQYIERIAVHSVGNKANGDAILLSSSELMPDESIRNLLATYFLSPFKSEEYYNLYHESSLELNEAYNFVFRRPCMNNQSSSPSTSTNRATTPKSKGENSTWSISPIARCTAKRSTPSDCSNPKTKILF